MADDSKRAAAPGAAGARPETGTGKPDKKGKKKGRGIASFLILFFILAALVSVIVFNLFNIRNRYIYPALAKLPLIGGFVPISAANPEDLGAMSPDQLIARVSELESQLSQAQDQLKTANDTIDSGKTEMDRLKAFESQQLEFKQQKADFDERIAMADPQAYADYYQLISPENAEALYPQAAADAGRAAETKKYLNDIKAMDTTGAADMLQQMIGSDIGLVVMIVQGLDSRTAGGILSEMSAQNAASVVKMMAPNTQAP